jgi:hypothetical protein
VRHRPLAALAALLLALQAVLHTFCMPSGAGVVAICTPHGIQLVPADPGEQPAPSHDCPACQAGHCGTAFAPPAQVEITLPTLFGADVAFPVRHETQRARFALIAWARGPPPADAAHVSPSASRGNRHVDPLARSHPGCSVPRRRPGVGARRRRA